MNNQTSSALLTWGHVLIDNLVLLNWDKRRQKYPFFDENITPNCFLKPNLKAFQCLIHFLLHLFDENQTSEKFQGLWPIKPGDKKTESQFRSTVFKWLVAIQKGEGTSQVTSKPTSFINEANEEAKHLGPVLLNDRLNASHFVSPVGLPPTMLLAKFSSLVSSVVFIRQHGSGLMDFAYIQVERPGGKENKRAVFRDRAMMYKAKTAESNLGNTLDSFVEDFESLHELTETLKFQHNELEQLIMNEKFENDSVDDADHEEFLSLWQQFDNHLKELDSMSLMSEEPLEDRHFVIDLKVQVLEELEVVLGKSEFAPLKHHLEQDNKIPVDDIMSFNEKFWRNFTLDLEKRNYDEVKFNNLVQIFGDLLNRSKKSLQDLKQCDLSVEKTHADMSKFRASIQPDPPLVVEPIASIHDDIPAPSVEAFLDALDKRVPISSTKDLQGFGIFNFGESDTHESSVPQCNENISQVDDEEENGQHSIERLPHQILNGFENQDIGVAKSNNHNEENICTSPSPSLIRSDSILNIKNKLYSFTHLTNNNSCASDGIFSPCQALSAGNSQIGLSDMGESFTCQNDESSLAGMFSAKLSLETPEVHVEASNSVPAFSLEVHDKSNNHLSNLAASDLSSLNDRRWSNLGCSDEIGLGLDSPTMDGSIFMDGSILKFDSDLNSSSLNLN